VVELGPGTGKLAARLLAERLQPEARYLGLDVSPGMVALASERLAPWGGRAEVRRVDGSLPLPVADGSCDRFLALWVLDLLDDELSAGVLAEAARTLEPGGLLCVAGLARGPGGVARLVSDAWEALCRFRPSLVGGCRPRELALPASFELRHRRLVTSWGITSEVTVAARLP